MRACIQRVTRARVTVDREVCGEIGLGMLVLLGVAGDDTEAEAQRLAEKIAGLRIFEDGQGKMNLALADVGGAMLVVSQFTLLGDCRRGRRPDFLAAAGPELAERLYRVFLDGKNVGEPPDYMVGQKLADYDFFSPTLQVKDHYLGSFQFTPGKHTLRLVCVGRNPLSKGRTVGLDSVRLRERWDKKRKPLS